MILRKIFWEAGLKSDSMFYLFAGLFFALAGISIGRLIFSQNIGLVAVFLISLASISIVDKQISISEILVGRTKRTGTKILVIDEIITIQHKITLRSVFEDHKGLVKSYFFLFLGIMICFAAVTFLLPEKEVESLFGEQFKIISSRAFGPLDTFTGLLANNFLVLLTCFFLALLFEFGTTFIIVWNASVWGTAIALSAKYPIALFFDHPGLNFILLMVIIMPHLVLEIISYFAATIGGGLLNKGIILEEIWSTRFNFISMHSIILFVFGLCTLVIAAFIETIVNSFLS